MQGLKVTFAAHEAIDDGPQEIGKVQHGVMLTVKTGVVNTEKR
jgi:hypothetical protein